MLEKSFKTLKQLLTYFCFHPHQQSQHQTSVPTLSHLHPAVKKQQLYIVTIFTEDD